MAKFGWVQATRIATERVANLRSYSQVAKLGALEKLTIPGIAYRRTDTNSKSDYALAAWSQQARIEARGRDVESINLTRLKELLPSIRSMTLEKPDDFCPKLIETLAQCGIALVFLPHIKSSFLHGASFYDGKKIVLGLTVRGRDANRFWFSLFHELAHILKEHIGKIGETDEADELEADEFAAEILIPKAEWMKYVSETEIDFTEMSVKTFADQQNIAPGIIVGRLQREHFIRFSQLNHMKEHYAIT